MSITHNVGLDTAVHLTLKNLCQLLHVLQVKRYRLSLIASDASRWLHTWG